MNSKFPLFAGLQKDEVFSYFTTDEFLSYCKLTIFISDCEIEKADKLFKVCFPGIKGYYYDAVLLALYISQNSADKLSIQQMSQALQIPLNRLLDLYKEVSMNISKKYGSTEALRALVD